MPGQGQEVVVGLDNGGTTQPPVVPPLRYRRSQYLTPNGHARVRDYLTGFKYGAEVACATGRRQCSQ